MLVLVDPRKGGESAFQTAALQLEQEGKKKTFCTFQFYSLLFLVHQWDLHLNVEFKAPELQNSYKTSFCVCTELCSD